MLFTEFWRQICMMAKIVWIDMEMSGLDILNDRIMEVACIITDDQLNIVAEHSPIVVHQPDTILSSMDEWCTTTHTKVSTHNVKHSNAF